MSAHSDLGDCCNFLLHARDDPHRLLQRSYRCRHSDRHTRLELELELVRVQAPVWVLVQVMAPV
ncbi:hypothetical protein [Methylomonas methanica]|uniref:hypothetical protein n=1 Tax=Methylomonas methanica TaxID=421 RepID=UPI0013895BC3|nr:hypothetical protein [Methylomonas methanica]